MTREKKRTARGSQPSESDGSLNESLVQINKSELANIVADAVKLATSDLASTVLVIQNLIQEATQHIAQQKQQMKDLQNEIKQRDNKITQLEQQLSKSNGNQRDLDQKLDRMARQLHCELNELEQYGRKGCVRIFGYTFNPEMDTTRAVLLLFKDKLNITLNRGDIIAAHPLPRKRQIDNRPTPPAPLFLKFVHYSDKESVIHSRRKLKNSGISIFEDLTRKNQLLLNRVSNDDRVVNAWFF